MSITVEDILERAAQYIERHGWSRDDARLGTSVCLTTAVCKVTGGFGLAYGLASDELRKRAGTLGLVGWNDEPGRTQREVLALLRIPGHCDCEMDGDQRATCRACRAREEME